MDTASSSEGNRSPLLRSVVISCLLVLPALLPVQLFDLPLNTAVVDLWNAITLPIFWLYLIRVHRAVVLPYIVAIWFILLGSFISMFATPEPLVSLTVLLKEVYIYVWFITLAALFASLDARDLRRIMLVWSGAVILNGVLILAQFVSPEILRIMTAYVGKYGAQGAWRPSGLFPNPNASAFFQAMGFVPLALVGPSRKVASILGLFLFVSTVATGSLGATSAFVVGFMIAVTAIPIVGGSLRAITKVLALLAMAAALLGGLIYVVISQYPEYQARFEKSTFGRAEESANGRFSLWQDALDTLPSENPLVGVGPGAWRDESAASAADRANGIVGKKPHNDLLAFAVERGVLGTLGLVLVGVTAVRKAIGMLRIYKEHPDRAGLAVVVFLAAVIAAMIYSVFHQVFHDRSTWLVLAMQEATLFRMMTFQSHLERSTRSLKGSRHQHTFVAQNDVTIGCVERDH